MAFNLFFGSPKIDSTFFCYASSIENLLYKILTTLLAKYSTILQIQFHEEQDIMSTPWFSEEKEEEKKK